MLNCKICSRPVKEEGYCKEHWKAYQNICEKFKIWQKALEVSWMSYLVNISKNSLTGEWAKEVVKYLIEDERRNVKEK
ncbi:MAG: hypothetical protein LBH62_00660 [Nitrososphaerota archaeon]|jgi:hypothetical protein|uniref:hypothetical protein n=1 Tax=Candidatus Bathycorpusculum sp. TaxID=2994959 RepID=UPI0028336BF2|nr:hypothetical protein [Candidatus Termiticorpusculum sp.]MCL2257693.1 hypothetical protein [Candidatus Termiticorpusculum sp.]MCL2292182.1 hypothetical protein [Candidatus Termiticorpusculum sp.]MDR0459944.1 hypothetical protein [Nitrososphaerota archaeon]